ncbi:MAG: hypothetical protein J7619_29455 [Dyadobacter sp.]|uniref:hypothetical protein n=1 Tax=Dyadobacter sp. TaxID=1914288 RepID=UPI001B214D47|nr:hypothetical protein [Dyadobacter sp.]MBO9616849.1 hypothetical protein [Dyadobacter sp.]
MFSFRAKELIDRLVENKISQEELAELLAGITNEKEQKLYSDALEIYFNRLLNENSPNDDSPTRES